MRLALYQPDMPANLGTVIRTAACLGIAVDIVEPCGFPLDHRALKRALMDYADAATIARHRNFTEFMAARPGRVILLSTRAAIPYCDFAFSQEDTLLLGRESAGVPEEVHRQADCRVIIPMRCGMRSLNIAQAAAMVLGEAMRQTGAFGRMGDA